MDQNMSLFILSKKKREKKRTQSISTYVALGLVVIYNYNLF